MNLEELKKYKFSEKDIVTTSDVKHISNYKQLIVFFENALTDSLKEGTINYNTLHSACLQAIRHLDNLIHTYDSTLQGVQFVNQTLDRIIEDNQKEIPVGNEEERVESL